MTDWQPIETAPKDGTPIRLWSRLGEFEWRSREGYWNGGWRKRWETLSIHGRSLALNPTHWQPLHAPTVRTPDGE